MTLWRDRFHQLSGQTRYAVCRIMLHLAGKEVAPLLGILNTTARQALAAEGDLQTLGEGLVEIGETLLQHQIYWRSAANEGDVFWSEGEAGDYIQDLFTDSAQRYRSAPDLAETADPSPEMFSVPVTQNLVIMVTVAYEGEVPALETDLASMTSLQAGLKSLINLHYQERLRAIQVHFSPSRLGDELTDDQILLNFPELLPL